MKIPAEYLEEALEPLVGTPTAVGAFIGSLSASLDAKIRRGSSVEALYDGLQADTFSAIELSVAKATHTSAADPALKQEWQSNMRTNGMFGMQVIVAGLRSVGSLYENHAIVPQRKTAVGRNVRMAMGQIHGIALADRLSGACNLASFHLGRDPHRLVNSLRIGYFLLRSDFSNFNLDRFFVVDDTNDAASDALVMEPKFRKLGRFVADHKCPVATTRVDTGEKGRKQALWALMGAVGSVAISSIYPRQFDIVPEV